MPSKTFLNLSQEKKDILLQSAMKEFARTNYSDASINQIIQDAGISRGSFYMYFTDKEDLYFYLLEKYRKLFFEHLLKKLEKNKGDFIQSFEDLYDEVIDYCIGSKNTDFFKNIFLNMRYTTEKKLLKKPPKEELEKFQTIVINQIDKSRYVIETEEELLDSIYLLVMITASSIAYVFMNQDDVEKERHIYHKRVSYLKYGLYQRKDEN